MLLEVLVIAGVSVLWWLKSIFEERNRPAPPEVFFKEDSPLAQQLTKQVTILKSPFIAPFLWGRSGQWQTLAYGILGNRRSQRWRPQGTRISTTCEDNATVSFDIFEPVGTCRIGEDVTFLICPGIANSSQSVYIRAFVHHALNCGFRCVVLNHLGVVDDIQLTTARLFTYGGTAEYKAMVDYILPKYKTKAIAIGFSMGANIVSCYLGESPEHQKQFICGISICQGYDIIRSRPLLLQWQQLRRAYMFRMANNMKALFSRHRHILFSEEVMKRHPSINVPGLFRATTLEEIDIHYTHILLGHESVDEMYHRQSSLHKLANITIPMLYVNSLDDPIVPCSLIDPVKTHARNHETALLVITRHGGHLGFLEGDSLLIPKPVSWLCRLVMEYTEAVHKLSATPDLLNFLNDTKDREIDVTPSVKFEL